MTQVVKASSGTAVTAPDPWNYRRAADGEIASWMPSLTSIDNAVRQDFDVAKGRAQDLALHDPYAANSVETIKDAVVGRKFRLMLMPDFEELGVTEDEANKWAELVEKEWEKYAEGVTFDVDVTRKSTFTFLMHMVQESLHFNGEALGVVRAKEGQTGYVTALQLIEPERLDKSQEQRKGPNGHEIRYGVERDEFGEPVAYHILDSHPHDWRWSGPKATPTRVERYSERGRPQVIHVFEEIRPSQTRGVSRQMLATLKQMKMLSTFNEADLSKNIQSASWAAVIQSEMDPGAMMQVLGANGANNFDNNITSAFTSYMKDIAPYYSQQGLRFNGSKVVHLYPNEKLDIVQGNVNAVQSEVFERMMVRQLAAGLGISYEELSRDFSQVSYSSARASLEYSWRRYLRQRSMLVSRFALPYVSAWLEEAIVRKRVPMLGTKYKASARGFSLAKHSLLMGGSFLSWGRPVIDPVKEMTARKLGLAMGVTTLSQIASENGDDHVSLLRQRARESKLRDQLGLNPAGMDETLLMGGIPKLGNEQEGRQAGSNAQG